MFIRQKYRIYPNKDQESILNRWIGCGRWIWNHMLAMNIENYNKTKKFIFVYDMNMMLPKLKKQENTKWLNEPPAQTLQQKCQDLDTALKASFKKSSTKKGFPKFKSKKTDESGIRMATYKFQDGQLLLPKISKAIKIKIDREFLGKPGMITIKKDRTGSWFVSFTVDVGTTYDHQIDKSDVKNAIGIDVGVKTYATTSDGELIKNPHFLKSLSKKLTASHKDLSRKQKGSHNREKSRIRLARLYKKITNKRQDFIKQNASAIAKLYDFVAVEDLNVSGLVKNHKLAKAIVDVSFGTFLTELEWQCKKRGKMFHKIDRWYPSSKTCSCCGHVKPELSLSERTFVCPVCQTSIDRDVNAAINILRKGLEDCNINIPQELGEFTPASYESTLVISEQETAVL